MTEEQWKAIPGYEGLYEASSLGHVRGLDRVDVRGQRVRGRVLSAGSMASGHLAVVLYRDGRGFTRKVHQLIMLAFVGPPPERFEVCHSNGNPSDNRLENLRYGSRSENLLDAVRHGTHAMASKKFCKRGHPFNDGNTYRNPGRPGVRACRTCRQIREAKRIRNRSATPSP